MNRTIAIDITMCNNDHCDKRIKCVRSPESGTHPHAVSQSWCEFNTDGKKRCKYYWDIKKK